MADIARGQNFVFVYLWVNTSCEKLRENVL